LKDVSKVRVRVEGVVLKKIPRGTLHRKGR
jgi:hypothetical protein